MKATSLLEKQHRKVEALFKKLEGGRSDAAGLVEELATNLVAHMAIEQNIFYPTVRSVKDDLVEESLEEHSIAEFALKRLIATDPDDASFAARVTALKELIAHHVKEEEEEMFPAVEAALGEGMFENLGTEMKAAFDEAMSDGPDALLPKSMAKTTADASRTSKAVKARISEQEASAG